MRWRASGDFEVARLPNGLQLFVRRLEHFRTALAVLVQRIPALAGPTATALVPFVQRQGCRAFPTERQLLCRLGDLYGASLDFQLSRFGPSQIVQWELEVPLGRFLGAPRRDLLQEGLQLLRDVFADPLLVGSAFRTGVLRREKRNLARLLAAQREQKDRYAYERCRRLLAGDSPLAFHPYGSEAEIPRIDERSLHAHYRRWLREAPLDLYIAGPLSREAAWAAAAAAFTFPRAPGGSQVWEGLVVRRRVRARRLIERGAVQGARLCLGFSWGRGPMRGREGVAMEVACAVLGGFPHARLFRVVREREGLAYSVGSALDRANGWLFIQAGVDKDARRLALALILEQVEDLRRRPVDAEELEKSLMGLRQGFLGLSEARSNWIEAHYDSGLLGDAFSIRRSLAALASVGPEDVRRAFRSLALQAVFELIPR